MHKHSSQFSRRRTSLTFVVILSLIASCCFLVADAAAITGYICGTQYYYGCAPGAYSCYDLDTTNPNEQYRCLTGGYAESKQGIIFTFRICVSNPNTSCDQADQKCRQDLYYQNDDCVGLCNDCYFYAFGCSS